MANPVQKKTAQAQRPPQGGRDVARLSVQVPGGDRELIQALARKLTQEGPEAAKVRAALRNALDDGPKGTSTILAALRRSPLVGADLDFSRPADEVRKVDL